MRLVKIQALNLEPGMYVAELDRPWLETPFALQGFVVSDPDEAVYVSNFVDHVYVDAEYAGVDQTLQLANDPGPAPDNDHLALGEDFNRAKQPFDGAVAALDQSFELLRTGRAGALSLIRQAIKPLVQCVLKNQEAMAALLRLQDVQEYRFHHGICMAVWAAILGRHIGLHHDEIEQLAIGCAMCDVGMTQLPPELLGQAENLSDRQRNIIRAHPRMGAELVSADAESDPEILAIIENHHERMDGSGYPRALQGADIPLLARIAGLVDTYDAMITARPYATARTSHEAIQELLDLKGTLFQESLVEQFVQAIGLFPTGTMVELNTGETAIIVTQNSTRRLKPKLLVVLDKAQHRLQQPLLVDLADQNIAAAGERWITRELRPGTHGVNSDEYFI